MPTTMRTNFILAGKGGGYFLVVGSNGYVPLDGVAFSGLTIMGLHFYKSYQYSVPHFQDFGGQKIKLCRHLRVERLPPH